MSVDPDALFELWTISQGTARLAGINLVPMYEGIIPKTAEQCTGTDEAQEKVQLSRLYGTWRYSQCLAESFALCLEPDSRTVSEANYVAARCKPKQLLPECCGGGGGRASRGSRKGEKSSNRTWCAE